MALKRITDIEIDDIYNERHFLLDEPEFELACGVAQKQLEADKIQNEKDIRAAIERVFERLEQFLSNGYYGIYATELSHLKSELLKGDK